MFTGEVDCVLFQPMASASEARELRARIGETKYVCVKSGCQGGENTLLVTKISNVHSCIRKQYQREICGSNFPYMDLHDLRLVYMQIERYVTIPYKMCLEQEHQRQQEREGLKDE